MKILLCHNFYRLPGGEDQVYRDEGWLLEHHGHEVIRYEKSNHSLGELSRLSLVTKTLWNRDVYREITEIVHNQRPDVVHFHNTFPLMSPSGYYAAHRAGAAVVQTMHNFRMICPAATLLRDNKICEKCVRRTFALPSVIHKCYRDSRAETGLAASLNAIKRLRRTMDRSVNRIIALTNHSRNIFVHSGLDAEKIAVKPNFVRPDPGVSETVGADAVFVGRLSTEKGIETLLAAWELLDQPIPLKIIGDGPLSGMVQRAVQQNPLITWVGQLPFEQVLQELSSARVVVFPSIWYETFGRSMIEAFASGTPVVASNIGSMNELVTDGESGLHFQVGDAGDLAAKVTKCFADQEWYNRARRFARLEYEQHYSASTNFHTLIDIYRQAVEDRRGTLGDRET